MIVSLSAPVCVHFKPEYNFETKFMLPVVKVVVPRGFFFFSDRSQCGFLYTFIRNQHKNCE